MFLSVFNGVRVMNRSTVNYFLNGISAPAQGVIDFLQGYGDWNGAISDWMNGFSRISAPNAFLGYTLQSKNVANSISELGLNITQLSTGLSPSCIYWLGSQGSGWILDLDTGSYFVICVGHYNPFTIANNSVYNAALMYRFMSQYI